MALVSTACHVWLSHSPARLSSLSFPSRGPGPAQGAVSAEIGGIWLRAECAAPVSGSLCQQSSQCKCVSNVVTGLVW